MFQPVRRHTDHPQSFAFEAELREHEAGGKGGEGHAGGAEVEEGDEAGPVLIFPVVGDAAKVEDVEAEEAEEDDELAPLGGVAPEDADVFDDEGASGVVHARP